MARKILPRELIEGLAREEVVLFVGRGLSPEYAELTQQLARDSGYSKSEDSLPNVASHYQQSRSLEEHYFELTDRLICTLNTSPRHVPTVYALIAQLPVRTVITTLYDTVLEDAFKAAGRTVHQVSDPIALPYSHPSKDVQVVHIWGCLSDKDKLKITKEQIRCASSDLAAGKDLGDTLGSKVLESTLLLIGCSESDPSDEAFLAFCGSKMAKTEQHRRSSFTLAEKQQETFIGASPILAAGESAKDGLQALNEALLYHRIEALPPEEITGQDTRLCFVGAAPNVELSTLLAGFAHRVNLSSLQVVELSTDHLFPLSGLIKEILAKETVIYHLDEIAKQDPAFGLLLGVSLACGQHCIILFEHALESEIGGLKELITPVSTHESLTIDDLYRAWNEEQKRGPTLATTSPKSGYLNLWDLQTPASENDLSKLRSELAQAHDLMVGKQASPMWQDYVLLGIALGTGGTLICLSNPGSLQELIGEESIILWGREERIEDNPKTRNRPSDRHSSYSFPARILQEAKQLESDGAWGAAWTVYRWLGYACPFYAEIYWRRGSLYRHFNDTQQADQQTRITWLDQRFSLDSSRETLLNAVKQAFYDLHLESRVAETLGSLVQQGKGDKELQSELLIFLKDVVRRLEEFEQRQPALEAMVTGVFEKLSQESNGATTPTDARLQELERRIHALLADRTAVPATSQPLLSVVLADTDRELLWSIRHTQALISDQQNIITQIAGNLAARFDPSTPQGAKLLTDQAHGVADEIQPSLQRATAPLQEAATNLSHQLTEEITKLLQTYPTRPLEQSLVESHRTLEELRGQLEQKQTEFESLITQQGQIEAQMDQARTEIKELKQSLGESHMTLEKLKGQLEQEQVESEQLVIQRDQIETQMDQARTESERRNEEISRLEAQAYRQQAAYKRLVTKFWTLYAAVSTLTIMLLMGQVILMTVTSFSWWQTFAIGELLLVLVWVWREWAKSKSHVFANLIDRVRGVMADL